MTNNNMANMNNIFIWEVTSVKLYKNNNEEYYYSIDGYCRCIKGNNCIDSQAKTPDINGNYNWGVYVEYDINNKKLNKVYEQEKLSDEELELVINNVE